MKTNSFNPFFPNFQFQLDAVSNKYIKWQSVIELYNYYILALFCSLLIWAIIFTSLTWFLNKKLKSTNQQLAIQKENEVALSVEQQKTIERLLQKITIVKKFEQIGSKNMNLANFQQKTINQISHSLDNNDWIELQEIIDSAFNDFTHRIKERFPKVSPAEIQLSLLIKINLNTIEISNILNTTENSIRTKKSRLKDKFFINKKSNSLVDFLTHF